MTLRMLSVCVFLAPLLLGGCTQSRSPHLVTGAAEVTGAKLTAPAPSGAPKRVYVQDFKLDVAATQQDNELIHRPRLLREIVQGNPEAQAKKIVDEMAESLVKDLKSANVPVERLEAGAPLPKDGWLV